MNLIDGKAISAKCKNETAEEIKALGVIENSEAVNKSYPTFFSVIKGLGIEVQDESFTK